VLSAKMKSSFKMCLKWAEGIVSSCYPVEKELKIGSILPTTNYLCQTQNYESRKNALVLWQAYISIDGTVELYLNCGPDHRNH
jgi:hypothetical protein